MSTEGMDNEPSQVKASWLGIDLGTTSVKVVLVDDGGTVLTSASQDTDAKVCSDVGSLGNEQDPLKIFQTVNDLVVPLIRDFSESIQGIGVTGQMHGLVLWGAKCIGSGDSTHIMDMGRPHSHLYTWQDQRCSQEFLGMLPAPSNKQQPLSTGHGCATLYWLVKNRPDFIDGSNYINCGTIMDFFVSCLCDLEQSFTSDQLAASFGYYNKGSHNWDKILYEDPEFPAHLLPSIVLVGTKVGHTSSQVKGWPHGVPVYVSLGDVQCAMKSLLKSEQDAAINLSTSVQLGLVMSPDAIAQLGSNCPPALSFFPYFGGQYLALFAGLNGGNTLGYLAECVGKWIVDLGFAQEVSTSTLLLRIQELAEEESSKPPLSNAACSTLQFCPVFYGERHLTSFRGSITGLSNDNFTSIGTLFRSACEGLLKHVHSMIPAEFLVSQGVSRLLATGSVPTRNSIIRQKLKEIYSRQTLQVVIDSEENEALGSATGAALVAMSEVSKCLEGS